MISLCIKINNNSCLDYIMNETRKSTISKITCKKNAFKIYDNIIIHYLGDEDKNFYNFISNVISQVIMIFFQEKIVKDIINLNYFYFNAQEKKVIFEEYNLLLKNKKTIRTSKNLIVSSVKKYIKTNKVLNLTGFINFRLKSYKCSLEKLVTEAVNQFILDKEYLQFVELLTNYVKSKIPNNMILHLIYINNEGILLNDKGEFVELEKFNSTYLSDISFSKNDYILNTLVGIIPSKIIIHLVSEKDQFIKTIELIFQNKVEYCDGCDLCSAYELLNLH